MPRQAFMRPKRRSYRVVGAIDAALAELDKNSPTYYREVQKRIEEFAVECSILKVFGSEMLDRVVDDMLQIHGGYGYVEEYGGGEKLSRFAHQQDFRRHQRDQPADHHRLDDQARIAGHARRCCRPSRR